MPSGKSSSRSSATTATISNGVDSRAVVSITLRAGSPPPTTSTRAGVDAERRTKASQTAVTANDVRAMIASSPRSSPIDGTRKRSAAMARKPSALAAAATTTGPKASGIARAAWVAQRRNGNVTRATGIATSAERPDASPSVRRTTYVTIQTTSTRPRCAPTSRRPCRRRPGASRVAPAHGSRLLASRTSVTRSPFLSPRPGQFASPRISVARACALKTNCSSRCRPARR